MERRSRIERLRAIESLRRSRVVTYVCATRRGDLPNDIVYEVVRPLYDHLAAIGRVPRLDLLVVSRGGHAEVPWRLIAMLREHCDHLGVLVPYRAQSSATLIALGADEIVMGARGELGPIDPIVSVPRLENGTRLEEAVHVEDMIATITFLRERANLNPEGMATAVSAVLSRVAPWTLGSLERAKRHVNAIARAALETHAKRMSEERIQKIIATLTELPNHNYRVARKEAEALGLHVTCPDKQLEDAHVPFDADNFLGLARDEHSEAMTIAMIDSAERTSELRGSLHVWRVRQYPSPIALQWGALPAVIGGMNVPKEAWTDLSKTIEKAVFEQVRRTSPVLRTDVRWMDVRWHDATQDSGPPP